jgi:predicted ArsR family transcriptional regulator
MERTPNKEVLPSASTRQRLLELIWRGRQTVDELARGLGLTDNAVRAQLVALERDGLVRQAGKRRGLRKPSLLYECTPAAEQLLPKPYPSVLAEALAEFTAELGPDQVSAVMRKVGDRLAETQMRRVAGLGIEARMRELGVLLRELGGIADVEPREGGYRIVGFSCPLRSVAAEHPSACAAMGAFIQAIAGHGTVRECCERDGAVRCHFELDVD